MCSNQTSWPHKKASGIDPSPLTPQQAMEAKEGQWMPLLSVPRILDVRPENPVINDPYITSDITSTTKWKEILSAEELPIVGINWQGNPDAEKRILSGRSLPLECFEPIATQSKFKLLSLQKGFGSEQLETCSFKTVLLAARERSMILGFSGDRSHHCQLRSSYYQRYLSGTPGRRNGQNHMVTTPQSS